MDQFENTIDNNATRKVRLTQYRKNTGRWQFYAVARNQDCMPNPESVVIDGTKVNWQLRDDWAAHIPEARVSVERKSPAPSSILTGSIRCAASVFAKLPASLHAKPKTHGSGRADFLLERLRKIFSVNPSLKCAKAIGRRPLRRRSRSASRNSSKDSVRLAARANGCSSSCSCSPSSGPWRSGH